MNFCKLDSRPYSCLVDVPVLKYQHQTLQKLQKNFEKGKHNILDTKPKLKPSSVEVRIPEIFVNIRLVRLRNPLAEKVRPLPNPNSSSAHPSGEVILLKDTLTEPEPEPLCVESSPIFNRK